MKIHILIVGAALCVAFVLIACTGAATPHSAPNVPGGKPHVLSVTVDLSAPARAISPYIYGTNSDLSDQNRVTARRLGGNRTTALNWETGASNAGEDWKHSSDSWLESSVGVPAGEAGSRGAVYTTFHEKSRALGALSLVAIPIAGWVAADTAGSVSSKEAAPSNRWRPILPSRGTLDNPSSYYRGALLDSGYTLDEARTKAVYQDELVSFLVERFGSAASGRGVSAYSFDNEPGLWRHTHPHVHPKAASGEELVARSLETARAVKDVDPDALLFGPESFGFSAYNDNAGDPEWPFYLDDARDEGKPLRWFLDWYLDQFAMAEEAEGRRLLDVLSVHWYPEARGGGVRITTADSTNAATNRARIQAPRAFWDPMYHEDSWIGQSFSWALPILPLLNESIDNWYPGTKLAITEYNFGGDTHISGGLAQADAFGVFAQNGVFLATWWPIGGRGTYVSAAWRLYRNLDGKGLSFGDQLIPVEGFDPERVSIWVSRTGPAAAPESFHFIVLNKSAKDALASSLSLEAIVGGGWSVAAARGFDESSAKIEDCSEGVSLDGSLLSIEQPPLSAWHVVLEPGKL